MEKYGRISKITNDYLHGQLSKLQIMYEDQDNVQLTMIYEDKYHYWFDYELTISFPNKTVQHANHYSEGYMNKVELQRENDFEQAVCNAITEG